MKYIGSFFRINSMSLEEIQCQLLFLSRESVKHILFESKCGVTISQKSLKKNFDKDEYTKLKELYPLLALYKKAKPIIYLSQNSRCWDESTFKKEIDITSNALMTLSLLKLSTYYAKFKNIDNSLFNLSKSYKKICKAQLDFYYNNLRNHEGFFISKRNMSSINSNYPELIEHTSDISFAEQSYMMCAYYLYSINCDNEKDKETFKNFSLEILDMFDYFKEKIYEANIMECCHLCYSLNLMYKYSKNDKCKNLLLDLCDFIYSKHLEVGINNKDISSTALIGLNLYMCYKNTNMALFKEAFIDICTTFKNIFNSDLAIFTKPGDKKEIKYYNLELVLYLLNLMIYHKEFDNSKDLENIICQYYKNSILGSSILTSFPEPPSIDSAERYKNFSMKSDDLLDETMFKNLDSTTLDLTALAPIFIKSQSFSKKKKSFSSSKTSFESLNNMFIFHIILECFSNDYIKFMCPNPLITSKNDKNNKKDRSSVLDSGHRTAIDSTDATETLNITEEEKEIIESSEVSEELDDRTNDTTNLEENDSTLNELINDNSSDNPENNYSGEVLCENDD